jgi:LAO/AO transport system kinase
VADLAERVRAGEVRALARVITGLENGQPAALAALAELFPSTGGGYVLGVTGSPGAGKSTLVDGLVRQAREAGMRVGVLAVDPSSPFGGGAILGDRIRMQAHAYDRDVYIRSMGARGHLGGLAEATRKAIHVLDAAGYGLIVVETVGVGQSELAIVSATDTTLVVVTPGMGDAVQTMKAGILEIADIFALNKADQEGTSQMLRALRAMLHMAPPRDWQIPIVETRAHEGGGIPALWEAVVRHRSYLEGSGELTARRAARLRAEVLDLVERGLRTEVLGMLANTERFAAQLEGVVARRRDPDSAARAILGLVETPSGWRAGS